MPDWVVVDRTCALKAELCGGGCRGRWRDREEIVLLGFAIEAAGSTSTRKRLSLSAQLARGWPCASCDEHCSSRFARKENSKKKTDEDVNLGFKFGQFEPLLWAKFSCASKLLTFNHPGFGNTNDYWTPICGPFNLKNHWYVLF
jgi:hypothetical protein